MKKELVLQSVIIVILFTTIFFSIFFADYAFLDEAHQLWHNKDGSNFSMFLVQGRLLTGLIIDSTFSKINKIAEIKYLRIFSWVGWMIAGVLWIYLLQNWRSKIKLDNRVVLIMGIFLPCSIPVAISIGWASCIEIYIAFIISLLSGHMLLCRLFEHKKIRTLILNWKILLICILGLCALFLYQTAFGAFLLPIFIYYISEKSTKSFKALLFAGSCYLFISIVYYFLFKYSLNEYQAIASHRTNFSMQPLKKISFFFSHPLAQAFSFNFLYNLRGVASQAFYPIMLVGWLITIFIKREGFRQKLEYIFIVLFLLGLMYLPVLIAQENFSSYRTMHCLTLAGTFLLVKAYVEMAKTPRAKDFFTYCFITIIIIVAVFNFNFNFLKPLQKEYNLVNNYLGKNFSYGTKKILFIRPTERLFTKLYGVNVYKDEFGVPSTYKDWTPEPLVRQIIFEITGDRKKAEQIEVINIGNDQRKELTMDANDSTSLLVDIEALNWQAQK